jgi:hypothetical protein
MFDDADDNLREPSSPGLSGSRKSLLSKSGVGFTQVQMNETEMSDQLDNLKAIRSKR